MSIDNLEKLEELIALTDEEKAWREDGGNTLPILISDHLEKYVAKPSIRRQFVPSVKENQDPIGYSDPLEEVSHECEPRLIHRYRNRAAFLVTDKCFAYCRHCFRRRFTGSLKGEASVKEIEEAASYIKATSQIKELLLTGGDMFTLSDSHLDRMLSIFKKECPDVILRLCTRALTSNPGRFTPELFSVIEKNQIGASYTLMTQFNTPEEITTEAIDALKGFKRLGIPMFNQSVLLAGVNDQLDTQVELANKLLYNGIKPYYLFQGDFVRGTSHLRVSIEKGLELEENMRLELSGLSMPQYTLDLPQGGGKIILTRNHLLGKDEKCYTFSSPEGGTREYIDILR